MNIPKIKQDVNIKDAMENINQYGLGIVFVEDENEKFIGVLTDGDIRRAILSGKSLDEEIEEIVNKDPIKIYESWSDEKINQHLNSPEVRKQIPKMKALVIPILNENEEIVGMKSIHSDGESKEIKLKTPEYHTPNKILIIGGAGYIGSVLSRILLENGYKVKVLDKLLYGDHGIEELYSEDNFELHEGDITNISDIVEAMEDVDAVVHLAAIVGDPATDLKPQETLEINHFSTKVLGEIAKHLGISKFVFASTCSVYGFNDDICKEETETNPLSLYGETKVISEETLLDLEGNGFSPVILRFATAYGLSPRMRFDLVVNILTAKAIEDNEITVYGEGTQMRPFAHIRDISQAIKKSLEAPPEDVSGEIFNVGTEEQNLSIDELAKTIHKNVENVELKYIKEKEDERSYSACYDKIKNVLNFEAEYSIEDAVEEIKEAFENGEIKGEYTDQKYSNYKSLKEDGESKWPD